MLEERATAWGQNGPSPRAAELSEHPGVAHPADGAIDEHGRVRADGHRAVGRRLERVRLILLRLASDLVKPTLKAPPKAGTKAKQRALVYEEVFEVDQKLEPNAPGPKDCDKVGGYPARLQNVEIPVCNKCNEPMRFAHLSEHDLNFTGGG